MRGRSLVADSVRSLPPAELGSPIDPSLLDPALFQPAPASVPVEFGALFAQPHQNPFSDLANAAPWARLRPGPHPSSAPSVSPFAPASPGPQSVPTGPVVAPGAAPQPGASDDAMSGDGPRQPPVPQEPWDEKDEETDSEDEKPRQYVI